MSANRFSDGRPARLPDPIPVAPDIPCIDFWAEGLPIRKARIYRLVRDEGQLSDLHCYVNRRTGSCTVTYLANQPHEWMLETLALRLAAEGP